MAKRGPDPLKTAGWFCPVPISFDPDDCCADYRFDLIFRLLWVFFTESTYAASGKSGAGLTDRKDESRHEPRSGPSFVSSRSRESTQPPKHGLPHIVLQELLTLFSSSMDELLLVCDSSLSVRYITTNSRDLTGRPPEEWIGRPLASFLGQEQHPKLQEILRGAGQRDESARFRARLRCSDDHLIPVDIRIRIVAGEDSSSHLLLFLRLLDEPADQTEMLIKREEQYRLLAESAGDMLFHMTDRGEFLDVSSSVQQFTGYERDELVGKSGFDFIPEHDRRAFRASTAKLTPDNPVVTIRHSIRHKDGRTIRGETTARLVLPDKGNGTPEIIAVTRNIGERLDIEMQLRKLSAAIEQGPSAVMLNDTEGMIEYVNRAFTDLTGYQAEEVIGHHPAFLRSGNHPQEVYDEIWQTIGQGRFWSGTLSERKKNGEVYWALISISPILDDEGRLKHYATVRLDDTQRKQALDALRESEERYRTLIESAPLAIAQIDPDGQIINMNPSFWKTLGSPSADQTRTINVLTFEPLRTIGFSHAVEECRDTGRTFVQNFDYTSKWGKSIYLRVHFSPVLDSEDHVQAVQMIAEDIAPLRESQEERIRLEKRILEAQQLESLGVLAGGIAHDFNNLLAGIMGNTGLAMMDVDERSKARQSLQQIEQSAERAAELTRQMLAYAGRGQFMVEPVNLSDIIGDITDLLQATIPKKIEVQFELSDQLPKVEVDVAQVRQIVTNILLNASEAIGDAAGRITVRTGEMNLTDSDLQWIHLGETMHEGRYVHVTIEDNGEGMDEETLSKMFEPFFSTRFTGRGLGLAAVQGIVRTHGGGLKVESATGTGTTFTVLFPLAEGDGSQVEAAEENGDRAPLVMVVDDEPGVRHMAGRILERGGYRVLYAEDGREAVDLYKNHGDSIACILLDLTMPHMNGVEAFANLHALNPDVKVLISSGFTEREAMSKFTSEGIGGFIQKPYKPMALLHRIQSLLEA
ncbi:PAS domain S-box protein [bacterium]|nr:PAS domain S-box protein [bacterium]